MAKHTDTGKVGEELAVNYFSQNGYVILHKNWRHSHWEVDIIATKDNLLHFIEVKTRTTKKFGLPEESVTKKKIQNLLNAAEEFVYQHPQWKRIQFNVLAITLLKDTPVEYFLIEDVYL
jgi:putative endonuclease